MALEIRAIDADRNVVYGFVPAPAGTNPDVFERAISDFMLGDATVQYANAAVAQVVVSWPTSSDLLQAFGLPTVPLGWIVGLHFEDPEMFQRVARGEIRAFPTFRSEDSNDNQDAIDARRAHASSTVTKREPSREREAPMPATAIRKRAWAVVKRRAQHLQDTNANYRGLTDQQAVAKAMREDAIAQDAAGVYEDAQRSGLSEDDTDNGSTVADDQNANDLDAPDDGQDDGPSTQLMLGAMKKTHAALGDAISAYGDTSKFPADHPVHKLKATHRELGRQIQQRAWMDDNPDEPEANDTRATSETSDRTGTPVQKAAWAAIEREADSIVTKSATPISKAKSIVLAMQKRPDLVAAYYADPVFDRAARR